MAAEGYSHLQVPASLLLIFCMDIMLPVPSLMLSLDSSLVAGMSLSVDLSFFS